MNKLILIADDSPAVRRALCTLFKSEAGFEVCAEAENGRGAIEQALQRHPDLIVLDLSMPVMNGLDAARVLKRLMPEVPIILFTNYSEGFSQEEVVSAGISVLISKSQPPAMLVNQARRLLNVPAA